MAIPTLGQQAPSFKELKEHAGQIIVLFFYPKDNTSGCTVEACSFRDFYDEIQQKGIALFGISPDSPTSHDKFIQKFTLPYPLIADEDKSICEKYGVWVKKSMYGRSYMGVARTTFIINSKGKIAHIFEKVKPEGHAKEVLDFISSHDIQ